MAAYSDEQFWSNSNNFQQYGQDPNYMNHSQTLGKAAVTFPNSRLKLPNSRLSFRFPDIRSKRLRSGRIFGASAGVFAGTQHFYA